MMKDILKAAIPSILIGVLSAVFTGSIMTARLEERIANLEKNMTRHEVALDKEAQRHESVMADLTKRTDDQERRLSRTESTLESIGGLLSEIRGDVKLLLREGKQ